MIGPALRLSAAQYLLLAEAMLLLAVAAGAVALAPFRRIAASSATRPRKLIAERGRLEAVRQVRWSVRKSARYAPWRAKCFEQGLAAQWMLRRRGVAATLHYGVARTADRLQAHVWTRAGESDVTGCENADDFTELARFPPT
ncbi:MAG: lasso peptide biosynthesis B2 protein [Brevundimonas sp.]